MSTMLISPNQSPGPSTATRASTARLLRLSTSTSPLITTNMALASSPSRNSVAPAGGVSTVSTVERYSSTSSLSAPKSPMFRSSAGPTGCCASLLIDPSHYYGPSLLEIERRAAGTKSGDVVERLHRDRREGDAHSRRRV